MMISNDKTDIIYRYFKTTYDISLKHSHIQALISVYCSFLVNCTDVSWYVYYNKRIKIMILF